MSQRCAKDINRPPVLLGGINSYRLLRNIVEAEQWAENLIGGGGGAAEGDEGGGEEPDRGDGGGEGEET